MKAFIKHFEAPQRIVKIKIYLNFSLCPGLGRERFKYHVIKYSVISNYSTQVTGFGIKEKLFAEKLVNLLGVISYEEQFYIIIRANKNIFLIEALISKQLATLN